MTHSTMSKRHRMNHLITSCLPSCISKSRKPKFFFHFLKLPNELIVNICRYLTMEDDISNFSRCNHRLHDLLTPDLYRYNIIHCAGSALLWAAMHGRLSTANKALRYGANPNIPVDPITSRPPLTVAISAGHLDIAERLLATGICNLDKGDRVYATPLSLAVSKNQRSFVELLLRHGAGATETPSLRTSLRLALQSGHAEIVQLLLAENTIDLNAKFQDVEPYLLCSLAHGSLYSLSLLVARKDLDVNITGYFNNTALMQAAAVGNLGAVHILLAGGACPNMANLQLKTALYLAAENGHDSVISALLHDDRVDIDALADNGFTPLMAAIQGLNFSTVRLFLSHGANPNCPDQDGCSPLRVAARRGSLLMVQDLLQQHGIDPDGKDHDGRTPLSYAAAYNRLPIVKRLLAHPSVDPNSQDNSGCTPLSWAAFYTFGGKCMAQVWDDLREEEMDTILAFLNNKRVNLNARDWNGRTVLSYAAEAGKDGIVRILIDKGADANLADNGGVLPIEYAQETLKQCPTQRVSNFQTTIALVKKVTRSAC